MTAIRCELWIGTKTGAFFRLGTFDSIAACRKYISECDLQCYREIHRLKPKEVNNVQRTKVQVKERRPYGI